MSPDTGEYLAEVGIDQEDDAQDGEGPANAAAAGFQDQDHQDNCEDFVRGGDPLQGLVDDGFVNSGDINAAGCGKNREQDIVPGYAVQVLTLTHGLHNEDQGQNESQVNGSLDYVREHTNTSSIELEQNQCYRQSLNENIPETG